MWVTRVRFADGTQEERQWLLTDRSPSELLTIAVNEAQDSRRADHDGAWCGWVAGPQDPQEATQA